jgi:hypothetical protein
MTPAAGPHRSLSIALAVFVWASALLASPLVAQDSGYAGPDKSLLRAEFWADLSPVPGVGDEWPVSDATARRRMLEEAAWAYSGLIWGFDFEYSPYDKARNIAERFVLTPLGSLKPETLSFAAGARKGFPDQLWSFVEYRPPVVLVELMESYMQNPWKGSQGIGKADMNLGIKGRRAAYEDALRLAVRTHVQGLEPNKPRLVRGRVVFERPPSLALSGGFYTSQVRARVMVVEIQRYKVY